MAEKAHWENDRWNDNVTSFGARTKQTSASEMGALMYIRPQGSTATAATDPNAARGLAAAAGLNAGLNTTQIQNAMAHAAQLTASGVDSTTAAKQAVAAQGGKEPWLVRLAHFLAHPIKTTRAALHPQSTMHGARHAANGRDPAHSRMGAAWYEHQNGLPGWDEAK